MLMNELAADDSLAFPDWQEADLPLPPVKPSKPFTSKFKALFLDELDAPGPEHEWLIDDILSAGDKCIIGGPSQSGKSFLAIHAGMCVATGTQFFGHNV
jgi:hypothetical protein